jgi:hypothetical protein
LDYPLKLESLITITSIKKHPEKKERENTKKRMKPEVS